MNRNAFFATCIVAFSLTPAFANESAESTVEFNRDIRPILSDNCFYCHGFDGAHREAGLRLDTFEGATEFDTVIPGDPDESELVRRILSEDPDEVMPPPDSEKTLTAEERDLIQRWIRQGAQYQEHWAWKPLHRPDVPKGSLDVSEGNIVGAPQTATHPVDAFLQQAWDTAGIEPTAAATPRDLLRRLSFDLRGLPPSIEDVEDLQADPSEENFLRFRDRWMNELPYAEHQAVRWLDLVRWADTSGFVSDEPIDSGAYRRWVIESFRDNMPFDQFSTAQLAGDLLPNPSDDDLIASGYNRIVNTNCEAGAIEAEQLYKLKGEHVRALGTVWMGLTTGCAECHDHKFDPILAKDYYSLAAFFDDLVEAGVYTPGDRREPLHYVYDTPTKSQSDKDLQDTIASLKDRIAASGASDMARWESEIRSQLGNSSERQDFVWVPAALPAVRVLEGEFDLTELDDQTVRDTRAADGELQRHHAAEFMTGYFKTNSVKTDSAKDAWYVDVWIDEQDRPEMLGIQISHGDYGRLGWRTANYETYYWGEDSSGTLDQEQPWNDPARVKRIGDLPVESGWVRLQVPLKDRISPVAGQDFAAVGMAWL
ncbi:MAG: DUF1549 domain-containing protein, partial [Rhodopirellula sp. JB044]|uniref:DUF1549 domain-containing protein n=1 Tax=Rhodopirellula sp. JB044 TaxID=3342844 RepID=UPI00370AEB25